MPRIDQVIGEHPPEGTEPITTPAAGATPPPAPAAMPALNSMMRSPLPNLASSSPDSLGQYYRSGIPQMRLPQIPPPPTGATAATAAITPGAVTGATKVTQVVATGGGTGTVTSVGLTMPAEFSVLGSPVVKSGTLAVTWAVEVANVVFAGPSTGVPASPTFRSLVVNDIPALPESKITNLTTDLAAKVPTSRTIGTTAPLTGGGSLAGDLVLAISDFVGSGASHARGAVPDPGAAAGTTRFLREDATFAVPPAGMTNPMTTLGDIIYEDASPTPARLAGNITATRKFLRQLGTGAISAVPAWDTVTATDVGLGSVTNDVQTKASVMPNTVPTNGQVPIGNGSAYVPAVLTAGSNVTITNGAGAITIAAAGGASGTSIYPTLTAPLAANFTWVNQLGSIATDLTSCLSFSLPTNATDPNWRLFKSNTALPSPPYSIVAAFDFQTYGGNYYEISLSLYDSVGGKFIDLNFNITGTPPGVIRIIKFNSVTSVSSLTTVISQPRIGSLFFLKITDDGANRKYWFGTNGQGWMGPFGTEATGTFVVPTNACIGCANFSGSTEIFQCFHWQQVAGII